MGLLAFAFAGIGFILIGALESFRASQTKKNNPSPLYISLSIFSTFVIANSVKSLFDAVNSNDAVGSALQLQVLAIAFIFLLYSLLSLSLPLLPSQLLSLVIAFGFAEEFLLFYLQRKDPSGVENRYYDLLLVPIAVCVFSTVLELTFPEDWAIPKLGRGIGLILQGTWFVQMGLSLFSNFGVAEGCSLHLVSSGNYTLRCKGHPEFHRAKAIATLQFNCHLALMVVLVVAFYAVVCGGKNGDSIRSGSDVNAKYTPIGAELQAFANSATFTLDSDDEEIKINGVNGNELKLESITL